MTQEESLADQVKAALEAYYDIESLQQSPLGKLHAAQRLQPPSSTLGNNRRGTGVRLLLDQAMSSLEAHLPRSVKLLDLQYRKKLPGKQASNALGIANSTLFDHRHKAIAELTACILDIEAQAASERLQMLRKSVEALPPKTYVELVGFDHYLKQFWEYLNEALAMPRMPLVVTGLGGLGKTSLAREAVERWVDQEVPPIEYVLFAYIGSTPRLGMADGEYELENLLLDLGAQAGLPLAAETTNEERARQLAKYLSDHPSLLFIDNVETPREVAVVAWLVERLAGVAQLLITSRHHFDGPNLQPIHLSELDERDARRLLAIEAERLEQEPVDSATAKRIYDKVGGHPLALKLVLGQMSYLPPEQVLDGLKRSSHLAKALYHRIYERSWSLLSSLAQDLLLGLLLLPPEGGTWAALRTAAESSPDDVALEDAVLELTKLNLLQVSRTTGEPTYTLHRMTYQFLERKVGWEQDEDA